MEYWLSFSQTKENVTSKKLVSKYRNQCPLPFSELIVMLYKTFTLNKVFSNYLHMLDSNKHYFIFFPPTFG